ncbi:MAG TPA: SPFH domain-containing protein [Gemmataceae bacterium]|nr:SPFH domain-containing protein [Gemmataceae bacterium]
MRRYWLLVPLLVLAAYLLTGVAFIRPGERAVVRRCGRVLDVKPGPGLWVGLPWGMDRLDRVPVNLVRRVEVGYQPDAAEAGATGVPGQLLTGDHNLVNLRVVIHYAVDPDEDEIVAYVLQADRTDALVARAVEAILAEWVAGRKIDDLLIRGKTELPPVLIRQAQERIRPYQLGIRIRDAGVAHLLPPDEVKPAFDGVTRAQTNIRTREFQAQQAAARRIQEAEMNRYGREQEAVAYADTQRRRATSDASRFDERRRQYWRLRQENADVLTAIWWEEMGKVFTGMKQGGRIDMLDHHLAGDGLDITLIPPLPQKK